MARRMFAFLLCYNKKEIITRQVKKKSDERSILREIAYVAKTTEGYRELGLSDGARREGINEVHENVTAVPTTKEKAIDS